MRSQSYHDLHLVQFQFSLKKEEEEMHFEYLGICSLLTVFLVLAMRTTFTFLFVLFYAKEFKKQIVILNILNYIFQ